MKKIDLSAVDFVVISQRTGNPVAAFLLVGDAAAYIAWRTAQEGHRCPGYDIVNADGSFLVSEPRPVRSFVTWADGHQFVAIQRGGA